MKKKNKKDAKKEIEIAKEKEKEKKKRKENGKLITVSYLTPNNLYNNLMRRLRRRHKLYRYYKLLEKVLL